VTIKDSVVKVGGATVSAADVDCTNGVIHIIDTVLLPPTHIVGTAVSNGNFKTLVTAVKTAKLVETLSGTGPFTVFAPTDAAFTKALTDLKIDAAALLARKDLGDILKFHVVSGKVLSTDLTDGQKVTTLEGSELTVTIKDSVVKVGGATVSAADVDCENGVIHIIDTVLLPPKQPNVVEAAIANGSFKTLAAALTEAKLVEALSAEGPFTVFAPTDKAFEDAIKALKTTAEDLLKREDLGDILKYHVHSGAKVMSADLKNDQKVKTLLEKAELTVKIDDKKVVKINDATVTTADVEASNGVIHIIDKVLLPPAQQTGEEGAVGGAIARTGSLSTLAVFGALLATTLAGFA
jgi:transforming growth factor-beta-induced protein